MQAYWQVIYPQDDPRLMFVGATYLRNRIASHLIAVEPSETLFIDCELELGCWALQWSFTSV